MDKKTYSLLENYMLSCMLDSAHDKEHIYRVLYTALDIAKTEKAVDYDVLICACLLHDIGRKEQFENSALCHAVVGGEKAYRFLTENGFDPDFAEHVKSCITTHRFRKSTPPQSLEAKILFDADKLDAAGAMGIARTLIYKGQVNDPLYSLTADGQVSSGETDDKPSFFHEYHYKLKNIYNSFYTHRGAELANKRRQAAENFYSAIYNEVSSSYKNGCAHLDEIIME
ncbi:MAG: HD domain-containing protein [Oscillospiraceae bacterium]|nr:HD domain-containing protein [Oscillospiraceae bacterium]